MRGGVTVVVILTGGFCCILFVGLFRVLTCIVRVVWCFVCVVVVAVAVAVAVTVAVAVAVAAFVVADYFLCLPNRISVSRMHYPK